MTDPNETANLVAEITRTWREHLAEAPAPRVIPKCPQCGTGAPGVAWTGAADPDVSQPADNWQCSACGHEWQADPSGRFTTDRRYFEYAKTPAQQCPGLERVSLFRVKARPIRPSVCLCRSAGLRGR
jgi:hypothetical protein